MCSNFNSHIQLKSCSRTKKKETREFVVEISRKSTRAVLLCSVIRIYIPAPKCRNTLHKYCLSVLFLRGIYDGPPPRRSCISPRKVVGLFVAMLRTPNWILQKKTGLRKSLMVCTTRGKMLTARSCVKGGRKIQTNL